RLGRAADPAHLGEPVRVHAELVERLDQVVSDRVVAAACAERSGGALVGIAGKTDAVDGCGWHQTGRASSSRSGRVITSDGIGCPVSGRLGRSRATRTGGR